MQSIEFLVGVFEFVLLLFSLSFHECAHAWMASRLGDQTARMQGRVTLNPAMHVDPIGTLLIPAIGIFGPMIGLGMLGRILIGWAKPTPIITRNFRKIRRDENLVTLAGPFSNFLLVLISVVVLLAIEHLAPGGRAVVIYTFSGQLIDGVGSATQAITLLAVLAINVNLSLFFFNLLPIPPLDGSHLLRNALPYGAVQVYDRIPYFLSLFLMMTIGGTVLRILIGPALHVVGAVLANA
ncbi:MAG TPA: site-2 protease family protein [Terracidiphilus sp.]|nr:site-2 protease family protein [Terracidiphilus sp.]